LRRRLRTRVIDSRVLETANLNPTPPWKVTIAALDNVLTGFGRAPATVILSSRFVRYTVLPWRDDVIGEEEQIAFARHCFKNIYGAVAEQWDIRVSPDGFGRNALACAVDAPLTQAIEKVLQDKDIPLASIQPHFMSACNRFHRQLRGHDSGCIAVVEPGRIAFGTFDKSGWVTLTTRRVTAHKPQALAPVLAQELRSLSPGALPENLFVASAGPTSSSFIRTQTRAWLVAPRPQLGTARRIG
jgi:hypothetical protein